MKVQADRWSRSIRRVTMMAAALVASAAALIVGVGVAQAHAAYKSSTPAANSVLKTAPTSVSITFVQRVSPQGLNITVYGNKGDVVSIGTAQISPTDPYTASIAMKGDGSDIYRVDWNNVSAEDNDPTLGAFVFAVDPSGTSDKVTPTPTQTVTTSPGVSPLAAILIGIGGLLVGAAGTYIGTRPRGARK